jgi:hypothetical protein
VTFLHNLVAVWLALITTCAAFGIFVFLGARIASHVDDKEYRTAFMYFLVGLTWLAILIAFGLMT